MIDKPEWAEGLYDVWAKSSYYVKNSNQKHSWCHEVALWVLEQIPACGDRCSAATAIGVG
jgi:hypothetical protein